MRARSEEHTSELQSPLQWVTYYFSIRMTAPCTNNLVEYEAVCRGMELLLEAGAEGVEVFGNSKLVISQLTEEYKCESELMSEFRYINILP